MLTTVFYPSDNDFGYIKATVRKEDITELLAMGWFLTQAEVTDPEEVVDTHPPVADNAKLGDGEPGSLDWHRNALAGMEDKDEIAQYVTNCGGGDIDKRGSIETVRGKALTALVGE